MVRKNFSQILKNAKIDLQKEYERLYDAFYNQKFFDTFNNNVTLRDCCSVNFLNYPFRGTCVSLDDFDETYKIYFEKIPHKFNLGYLILFCEYTYNLVVYLNSVNWGMQGIQAQQQIYCTQVNKVIDKIGYQFINDNGVIIFVPKSQDAISVAEIIDPKLSYKVIEYNHHTMQGNIEGKKAILLLLADKLEHDRDNLKSINKTMETNLFMLFNKMNLRHDNCSEGSSKYVEYVAHMSKRDLENWYDETYQLCLLAFLELDNIERNKKIADLKNKIGKEKTENQKN